MIIRDIWLDIKAVQERDPAARNALEVLLLYQGVHALICTGLPTGFTGIRCFLLPDSFPRLQGSLR